MLVTVFAILVFVQPVISCWVLVLMMALQSLLELKSGLPLSTTIFEMFEQFWKGFTPIFETDWGMLTAVIPMQFANAAVPIEVREIGKSIDVNAEQSEKDFSSIVVTESDSLTDVKLLQPRNAKLSMVVTEEGMETEFKLLL